MEPTRTLNPKLETGQYRLNLSKRVPVKLLASYTLYGDDPSRRISSPSQHSNHSKKERVLWTVESALHEHLYYDLEISRLSDYVLNEMEVLAWASKVNNG